MRRVLILDSDDDSRDLLRAALESRGWEVDAARDRAEAVERLRGERPCAVVSEYIVPWPRGECTLDWLPQELGEDDPPEVVVWSANVFDDVRLHVESRGATFLPKPMDPRSVAAAVERRLSRPKRSCSPGAA